MLRLLYPNFKFGRQSGGPMVVTFERESEADTVTILETDVATLLDHQKLSDLVKEDFDEDLAEAPGDQSWPDHVRQLYAEYQDQDGEPVVACPAMEELRDVLVKELADDPAGIGYEADGKLDATRVSKLIRDASPAPNILAQTTVTREATMSDYAKALKKSDVKNLALVGWIDKDEAIDLAEIELTVPDPDYQGTVDGPSRLDTLFQASTVRLSPADRDRAIADAIATVFERV